MRELLVLEPFNDSQIEEFARVAGPEFKTVRVSNSDEDSIKNALKTAEIVIGVPSPELIRNPEVDCPNLKLVQMTWAGTDIYTRGEIPFPSAHMNLCNARGAYGMVISQFVIGQILSIMLHFKTYHLNQEREIWQRKGNIKSLEGAKVLIFGAGDIGTNTAKRLTGFDAYTIGVCRDTTKARPYFNELTTLDNARKYLPEVDVIVCCIPNTKDTEGYFDADTLKLIKNDAIIVNVGRGNFIDNIALNEELNNGHLFGAALDVTNPEPLPENHPLWSNPRCFITPHASGVGFGHLDKTVDLIADIAIRNIKHYIAGEELENKIY